MLTKIKQIILAASLLFMFLGTLAPALTLAAVDCTNPTTAKDQIICGTGNASGTPSGTPIDPATASNNIDTTINTVVNLLSIAVGIVAVIMLVIGGFRYVTSGGDATKVTSAKNSVTYSLIGLVIVALAQVIVKFVLNKTTQ